MTRLIALQLPMIAPAQVAPTTELRQLQYREDDRLGVGKRSRTVLAAEYVRRYREEILDQVDLEPIAESLTQAGSTALGQRKTVQRSRPPCAIQNCRAHAARPYCASHNQRRTNGF